MSGRIEEVEKSLKELEETLFEVRLTYDTLLNPFSILITQYKGLLISSSFTETADVKFGRENEELDMLEGMQPGPVAINGRFKRADESDGEATLGDTNQVRHAFRVGRTPSTSGGLVQRNTGADPVAPEARIPAGSALLKSRFLVTLLGASSRDIVEALHRAGVIDALTCSFLSRVTSGLAAIGEDRRTHDNPLSMALVSALLLMDKLREPIAAMILAGRRNKEGELLW